MGVLANKRNGHQAEAEAAEITRNWPTYLRMFRTGLDGSHDLTGPEAVGEVKAVRVGPVWLKSALSQLDNCTDTRHRLAMVKLSRRKSNRTGWLVVLDLEEFERLIHE